MNAWDDAHVEQLTILSSGTTASGLLHALPYCVGDGDGRSSVMRTCMFGLLDGEQQRPVEAAAICNGSRASGLQHAAAVAAVHARAKHRTTPVT